MNKKNDNNYDVTCYMTAKAWKNKPNTIKEVIEHKFRDNYVCKNRKLINKWPFDEVIDMLCEGHSIMNGTFRNPIGKEKNTFIEAQFMYSNMVIIDIGQNVTLEEILTNSMPYIPSAIYTTYSHNEVNNRYRVLFLTDENMDKDTFQRITLYFMNKLSADYHCKDVGRFYFGGKSKVYFNPNLISIKDFKSYGD